MSGYWMCHVVGNNHPKCYPSSKHRVFCEFSDTTFIQCTPLFMPNVEIVFCDPHLLVINKPAGLLSVPGRGPDKTDCALSRINEKYPATLVVHRLDQATSGLMVFARTPLIQRELSKSFATQNVSKCYLAIVQGLVKQSLDWQRIDAPIGADWPNRPMQKIDPMGKPSTTLWRCIANGIPKSNADAVGCAVGDASGGAVGGAHENADLYGNERSHASNTKSLLELIPLSGRTHQLRVHLMSLGMPIIGDTLYMTNPLERSRASHSRMCLHAHRLEFTHPATGETLKFSSEADFVDLKLYTFDFGFNHPYLK